MSSLPYHIFTSDSITIFQPLDASHPGFTLSAHCCPPLTRLPAAVVRAAAPDTVLRLVEEPEFRYEDFAPRGEQSPTTMRAQVALQWPRHSLTHSLTHILTLARSHSLAHHCLI